uniref:Uncharacterized protein n=1 Tax=Arundo donax TaxID=35708 RepID=A0A0A8ZYT6_ARUDO
MVTKFSSFDKERIRSSTISCTRQYAIMSSILSYTGSIILLFMSPLK